MAKYSILLSLLVAALAAFHATAFAPQQPAFRKYCNGRPSSVALVSIRCLSFRKKGEQLGLSRLFEGSCSFSWWKHNMADANQSIQEADKEQENGTSTVRKVKC
jgi:hypothetical protein